MVKHFYYSYILPRLIAICFDIFQLLAYDVFNWHLLAIFSLSKSDLKEEIFEIKDLLLYLFSSLIIFKPKLDYLNLLILLLLSIAVLLEKMGDGDLYLIAIFSLYINFEVLSMALLFASFMALSYIAFKRVKRLSFGPYLLLGFYLAQSRIWNMY